MAIIGGHLIRDPRSLRIPRVQHREKFSGQLVAGADQTRDTAYGTARVSCATNHGDKQVELATGLGDALVVYATGEGDAGMQLATDLNTASDVFASDAETAH